jgi:hypothetical protein
MLLKIKPMSINTIIIWIFVLGYLWVNVRMQFIFFSGAPISGAEHLVEIPDRDFNG